MPELRLVLLVAGVALILGLIVWERVKRQRASINSAPRGAAPVISDSSRLAPVVPLPPSRMRESPPDLPIIEIGNDDALDVSFASEPRIDPVSLAADTLAKPVSWEVLAEKVLTAADLKLDWPQDSERQIIALRVVPRSDDRLAGRSVRQALVGAGFVHGPMEIFHLPREDGRVLLSAASLTKPGVFHLETMDVERFAGLNLFAVLPGALSTEASFERLVETGRGIATRLNAELRDPNGELLTTARVVAMRSEVIGAGQ